MRIGVLGAGSIGTLFGVLLHQSGNDVVLYNRNRAIVRTIKRNGVIFVRRNGRRIRVHVAMEFPPRTLRNHDLVLVTVKAYDTLEVGRRYAGKLEDETIVLTLQNGLGNYETLTRRFGLKHVLVGSTSEAALTVKPGMIAHTGNGRTWIGEYDGAVSDRSKRIARMLRVAELNATVTSNIRGVLWSKAIINSAINPITALTGLPNGEIRSIEGVRALMRSVIDEGIRVSRAEHVILEPASPKKTMRQVLVATARNRSSMLRDVEHHRKTEIEQLNGMIVKAARKHWITVPRNRMLLDMVRFLESSYMQDKHQ